MGREQAHARRCGLAPTPKELVGATLDCSCRMSGLMLRRRRRISGFAVKMRCVTTSAAVCATPAPLTRAVLVAPQN